MKEQYTEPSMSIVEMREEDVVCTSGGGLPDTGVDLS